MHVGTSTVLGGGYAGVLAAGYGVPTETAVLCGAMCGFSGMLPDLDSDYGVPLRETMAFAAATIPMLLVGRFQSLALSHDAMVLVAVGMYLAIRFGATRLIRRFTVHRGMFHSIPAMLIFGGLAFLLSGTSPIEIRFFKAGGVMGGFFSHLLLDEIYAVEWKHGRWRFKSSFGTAIKFWGDDLWSNFSTYAKLGIVAMMILGEPSVMEQIEARNPQVASQLNQLHELRDRVGSMEPGTLGQLGAEAARATAHAFHQLAPSNETQAPNVANRENIAPNGPPSNMAGPNGFGQPNSWQWPTDASPYNTPNALPRMNGASPYGPAAGGLDTARRPRGGPPQ
ncbi:MAG: metal-dependent hydrolase [Pirellulales bacterium]|nr:metal-dependent hydrolase [Pirellulales bacterium]